MSFLLPAAMAEKVEKRVAALRVEVLGEYDILKRADLQRELRDFEEVLRLHEQAVARGHKAVGRGT